MQDLIGAGLTVAVGLVALVAHPLALRLEEWSYDSSLSLRPEAQTNSMALVTLDATSRKNLQQAHEVHWDRQLHATLLDRLMARGVRLVVFTTVFSETSAVPASDTAFAQALRRARGRVVLAASATNHTVNSLIRELSTAAPWGVLSEPSGTDDIIRRHGAAGAQLTLAARAAQLLGAPSTNAPSERWFNYASRPVLPVIRYDDVLNRTDPAGALRGKVVIIGTAIDESPALPGPGTRWTGRRFTQPEIEAIAILNLQRREWLSRLPATGETVALVISGIMLGLAFMGMRPWTAALLAVGVIVLMAVGAAVLVTYLHLWFPWLVVVAVQIPTAIGWAALCGLVDRSQLPKPKPTFQKLNPNPGSLPVPPAPTAIPQSTTVASTPADSPNIPDHTLIKCIGRGAYGEVWLARDIIGHHHAVKIVKARNFPQAAPYEREFTGIEHFAPISRTHPGLMQVLHVGRHDAAGYFFYIMDLADDANGQTPLDPEHYQPRTLASELVRRGHLSARESAEIGLTLCAALEHLHQHKLVHRDLKPSNIIFVDGKARIADIGLVAQLASGVTGAEPMTRLGTEGYLPPEGPGALTADIYGLGMVLYEISMGRDRWQFPEFPTTVGTRPDQDLLRKLHEIILTACETDPADRFPSAAAMKDALARL